MLDAQIKSIGQSYCNTLSHTAIHGEASLSNSLLISSGPEDFL